MDCSSSQGPWLDVLFENVIRKAWKPNQTWGKHCADSSYVFPIFLVSQNMNELRDLNLTYKKPTNDGIFKCRFDKCWRDSRSCPKWKQLESSKPETAKVCGECQRVWHKCSGFSKPKAAVEQKLMMWDAELILGGGVCVCVNKNNIILHLTLEKRVKHLATYCGWDCLSREHPGTTIWPRKMPKREC